MSDPVCVIPVSLQTTPQERVDRLNRYADQGTEEDDVREETGRVVAEAVTERDKAQRILSFMHSLPFRLYPPNQECFAPAAYVLHNGGDCDNLAVLMVSMCRLAGIPARIVWINQRKSNLNHVTVVVHVDDRWYWADPSIKGARLGEDPYSAERRVGQGGVLSGPSGQSLRITSGRESFLDAPMSEHPLAWAGVAALLVGAGYWYASRR